MPEPPRIALTLWAAAAFLVSLALAAAAVPGLPWQAFLFPLLSLGCVVSPAAGNLAAVFLAPISGVLRDFVAAPYFAPAELVVYGWTVGWFCRRAAEKRFSLRATALDPWIVLWLCVFLGSGVAELRLGDAIRESLGEGLSGLPSGLGRHLFDYRIMLRPLFVPLAGIVAYCAAVQSFPDENGRRQAGNVFLVACGCVALYALIQFLFEFRLYDGYRVRGGLVAINLLASLLVLGLGLSLAHISRPGGRMKWIAPAVLLLNCCALLVIRSRAGWMGAVGAVSIFVVLGFGQFTPRIRRTVVTAAIVAAATVAALAMLAANVEVEDRYTSVAGAVLYSLNGDRIAQTVELRLPFWAAATHAIADRPVLGIGLGRFWSSSYIWDAIGRQRHAHNTVLNLTAELGLVGLTAWLLLITMWFRSWAGEFRVAAEGSERIRLAGILAAVGGFLVTGITDDPLAHSEGQIFFWTALALGMPLVSARVWTPVRRRIAAAVVAACMLSLAFREPRPMDERERQFLKLPEPPAASGAGS